MQKIRHLTKMAIHAHKLIKTKRLFTCNSELYENGNIK